MPTVTMKGSGFKPNLDWIRRTYGEEVWNGVLARLNPEERRQVELVNAALSYPSDLVDHVMASFAEVRFPNNRLGAGEAFRAMGRAAAEEGLSGIFSVFLKIASPEMTFKRAVGLISNIYSGVEADADVRDEGNGRKLGILVVHGLGEVSYASPRLCGYAEGAFSRLKVRDLSVRERTWDAGAVRSDELVFEVRWTE